MTDELNHKSLFRYSPTIVRILYQVLSIDRLTIDERAELEREINAILGAWIDNEDIGELRRLLDVQSVRGRRPKWRTVLVDSAIAHEVAEQIIIKKKQPAEAKAIVAERHELEIRKVERAFENWGDEALEDVDRASKYIDRISRQ